MKPRIIIAFLVLASLGFVFASTGLKDAGTVVSDSSVGTVAWSNPSNATASNDTYATAFKAVAFNSEYLKGTNFGFTVPSGATINGVRAEVERASTNGLTSDLSVRLVKGGVVQGVDKAGSGAWGSSDFTETYGNSTDLWGLTLTAADVNASNFGFVIQAQASGQDTMKIDVMSMTVWYLLAHRVIIITRRAGDGATHEAS